MTVLFDAQGRPLSYVGTGPGFASKPVAQSITVNGQSATVSLEGVEVLQIMITGVWTGTIQPQVQLADGSWVKTDDQQPNPMDVTNGNGWSGGTSNPTAMGLVYYNLHGNRAFRVIATATMTGTVTVNYTGQIGHSRFVTPMSPDSQATLSIQQPQDGLSASTGASGSLSLLEAYNGATFDMVRTVEALAVTGPVLDKGVLAVGVGPGYSRRYDPASINATTLNAAITLPVNGVDVMTFAFTSAGTSGGFDIFEVTADDSTWFAAGYITKLTQGPDVRVQVPFQPVVGDLYLVRVTGARQVRLRVSTAHGAGTIAIKATATFGVSLIKGSEMAPPPHNTGYLEGSFTGQYTTAQSGVNLSNGNTAANAQLVVTYFQIGVGGTTAATQVTLYFGTGSYVRGTNRAIFDHEFAPSSTSKPGFAMAKPNGWMGLADEELRLTSVGNANPLTVTVWYYYVYA